MTFHKTFDLLPEFIIVPGSFYAQKPEFNYFNQQDWKYFEKYREYLGDHYSSFRIYDRFENGWFIRSAAYCRTSYILIQFSDYCEILQFPVMIENIFTSFAIKKTGTGFELKIGVFDYFLHTKEKAHLGEWSENRKIQKNENAVIDIKSKVTEFWYEFIAEKITEFLADKNEYNLKLHETYNLSIAFIEKIYDKKNWVHREFIRPDQIKYDLNRELYSLPTYEFARIYFLSRLHQGSIEEYRKRLEKLLLLTFIELPEIGAGITHNTIGIDDYNNIYPHTQFNTGLAGYPGGIASDLIYILFFYKESGLMIDPEIKNKIKKLLQWLEYIQNEDSSFPYTVPSVETKEELFYKCPSSPLLTTAGGAGAAALAFLLWYEISKDIKYLDLCRKTLTAILPTDKYFYFKSYGFLRDAGASEVDGVSVYYIIKTISLLKKIDEGFTIYLKPLAAYIFQWQYSLSAENKTPNAFYAINGYVNPMTDSFSPRLAIWDTLLWSEMYLDIFNSINDKRFLQLSKSCFEKAVSKQNLFSGGIPESIAINYDLSLSPVGINNGVSIWIAYLADLFIQHNSTSEILDRFSDTRDSNAISITNDKNTSDKIEINIECALTLSSFKHGRFLKYLLKNIPLEIKKTVKDFIRKNSDFTALENRRDHNSLPQNPLDENSYYFEFIHPSKYFIIPNNNNKINFKKTNTYIFRDILRVYCPVINFNSDIVNVTIIENIGRLIRKCSISLTTNEKYVISFLNSFPAKYFILESDRKKIYFDVTLTRIWEERCIIESCFEMQYFF